MSLKEKAKDVVAYTVMGLIVIGVLYGVYLMVKDIITAPPMVFLASFVIVLIALAIIGALGLVLWSLARVLGKWT